MYLTFTDELEIMDQLLDGAIIQWHKGFKPEFREIKSQPDCPWWNFALRPFFIPVTVCRTIGYGPMSWAADNKQDALQEGGAVSLLKASQKTYTAKLTLATGPRYGRTIDRIQTLRGMQSSRMA